MFGMAVVNFDELIGTKTFDAAFKIQYEIIMFMVLKAQK